MAIKVNRVEVLEIKVKCLYEKSLALEARGLGWGGLSNTKEVKSRSFHSYFKGYLKSLML
jgi:hypothetical protein